MESWSAPVSKSTRRSQPDRVRISNAARLSLSPAHNMSCIGRGTRFGSFQVLGYAGQIDRVGVLTAHVPQLEQKIKMKKINYEI